MQKLMSKIVIADFLLEKNSFRSTFKFKRLKQIVQPLIYFLLKDKIESLQLAVV